jgi:hypothetical protein
MPCSSCIYFSIGMMGFCAGMLFTWGIQKLARWIQKHEDSKAKQAD